MTCELPTWVRAVAWQLQDPTARTANRPDRADTYALRDALLEVVGHRYPALPHVLFSRVRDDWGDIGERRLWRALAWLVSRRKIVRIGGHVTEADAEGCGYVRARDGGAETDGDRRARERLELDGDGLCYECREPTERTKSRGRYCKSCYVQLARARAERAGKEREASAALAEVAP